MNLADIIKREKERAVSVGSYAFGLLEDRESDNPQLRAFLRALLQARAEQARYGIDCAAQWLEDLAAALEQAAKEVK